MIDNFLLLINLDSESTSFIEDILIIVNYVIDLARQTAATCNDQLPLRLKRVLQTRLRILLASRLLPRLQTFPRHPHLHLLMMLMLLNNYHGLWSILFRQELLFGPG